MSDLSELLKQREANLNASRDSAQQKQIKQAEEAKALRELAAVEGPRLMALLKEKTESQTYDGKRFFWSDRSVMLGHAQLTVWSESQMGLGPMRYRVRLSYADREMPEPHDLIPEVKDSKLLWSCYAISLGKDRSTKGWSIA